MNIRYKGRARVKVEGVGYFDPQEEKDVDKEIGEELCRGDDFEDVDSTQLTPASSPAMCKGEPESEEHDLPPDPISQPMEAEIKTASPKTRARKKKKS